MHASVWRTAPLILLLPACIGGKPEQYVIGCEEEPAVVVDRDSSTALGFSGADLLALATGTWDEALFWGRDGSEEAMTLTVADDGGEVRFIDSVQVLGDELGYDPATYTCVDRIEADVSVTFATASGAFNEGGTSTLSATASDEAELALDFDPQAMGGTYDVQADLPEANLDTLDLFLNAGFTPGVSSGGVYAYSEDPEVVAIEIGAWGASATDGTNLWWML